jgi:pyruvate dehydrogenase E2 component (dihydrolipoamide acetyltransferase)
MATDVLMPQMGESVAEGTIVRWIKRVGDAVGKDEPLFEISTDKVDAEIPSPEGGVLAEIRVQEGDTVAVNTIVAVITGAGEILTPSAAQPPAHDDALPADGIRHVHATPGALGRDEPDLDEQARSRTSPVVRRLARDLGVDVAQVAGTGEAGRVTKRDVELFAAGQHGSVAEPSRDESPDANVRVEKMSVMRKKIAEHMLTSVRTSPHVYSTYDVDFGRIAELRTKHQASYAGSGAKLTYTACIAKATIEAIREFPFANASLDGDTIVYKNDINLGIAVALDHGLIVPVIRQAQSRSLKELSIAIQDLAARARSKQLKPEEVQDGTFTVTNPGMFGGLLGFPIISQPQVAILAIGSIEKRAVVVDDTIAIRPIGYLTLGYDHRLIDGADGGRFLQGLKNRLQQFDESWV